MQLYLSDISVAFKCDQGHQNCSIGMIGEKSEKQHIMKDLVQDFHSPTKFELDQT